MASLGKIKLAKKYESCRSDSCIRGRDNVEYTELFTLDKKDAMQFIYDDYDFRYWIDPEMKEAILQLSKTYFETTERSMVISVPTNPDYITLEHIEDAYIRSLIYEIKRLTSHEKTFKKAIKAGYTAIGMAFSSQLKTYSGTDVEAIKRKMEEDYVADEFRYFSLKDFNLLEDYDWSQPVNLGFEEMIPKKEPKNQIAGGNESNSITVVITLDENEIKKLGLSENSTKEEATNAIHEALSK